MVIKILVIGFFVVNKTKLELVYLLRNGPHRVVKLYSSSRKIHQLMCFQPKMTD